MTYTYKILTDSTYEVIGDNYKSIFNGTEADAINTVQALYDAEFNPLKDKKIKQLYDKYQKEYNDYLAQYPKGEVDSFEDKRREASAWNLDNTTPTPIIDNILATLGEPKADYVNSILTKVAYLAQKEGEMVKTRDAIKACTTVEELDAIEV